jgi:pyruvate kinase
MDTSNMKGYLNAHDILKPTDLSTRKTKIVCTIGPACANVETLVKMIDLGMNIARLNFSHGDHVMHAETVRIIREANKQRPEKAVAIMLDTKGPEIRTGLLRNHEPVQLEAGQELIISTDYTLEGDSNIISCSYPKIHKVLSPGKVILIADGTIVCEVIEILDNGVKVQVKNSCKIGEKKNMCLPGISIDLPTLTEKDEDDLENFALKYNLDFIAASFVRRASDIDEIRDVLGPRGAHIKIISKIENHEGLENFEEILRATDGVMVARGDLGMEIPAEKVFLAQKMMIQKCKIYGKPVITATQMLESMINNPRPTRAEASDVANAVLDGTDAVMLSGETANGKYPLNAVEIMAKVCVEAERCIDYSREFDKIKESIPWDLDTTEAVCAAAVRTALDLKIKLIIVITDTGNTPLQVAKFRPPMAILAVSMSQAIINQMNVVRGAIGLKVPSYEGTDNLLRYAIEVGKSRNLVTKGDTVIAMHGRSETDVNRANTMKILIVDEEEV